MKVHVDVHLQFALHGCIQCLSVCVSVCLSVCVSVRLPVFLSVSLSVCLSVSLSVRLSLCLSVRPSVCPSVRLSVRPSVSLSVRLSICLSVRLSVCLSVRPSVCLTLPPVNFCRWRFMLPHMLNAVTILCRSQWPRGLRRRSSAAFLLRSWVRILPGAWLSVCCECCLLSGRGLCYGLITRQEESYRVWCVWVWSWNLGNEETPAHGGVLPYAQKGNPTAAILGLGKVCKPSNNISTSFRCEWEQCYIPRHVSPITEPGYTQH